MKSLTLDGGLLLWTLVTFGCLLAGLARYAFKPLREALTQREAGIRDAVKRAEAAREAAEKVLESNEEKLTEARLEARKIIGEGHRIVETMKQEAQAGAREEADQIVAHARAEIDQEVKNSMNQMKETVVNLSLRITRQVIKEELNEQRHDELAERLLEQIKQRSHDHRS